MVASLAKKVELLSKKVGDNLFRLLCFCGGHLSLTRPLLESLLTGIVKAGWEEVGRRQEEEREGEEGKGRLNWKAKGQKSRCRQSRQGQGQGQRQGRRLSCEVKAAGRQEEGWQEVSAALGLCFGSDSALAGSMSTFGLSSFRTLYDLDWTSLCNTCRFLCSSFPPSTLLNERLCRLVQIICVIFEISTSTPKFNIFDYTTYPDLSVKVEQDLLFMVTA